MKLNRGPVLSDATPVRSPVVVSCMLLHYHMARHRLGSGQPLTDISESFGCIESYTNRLHNLLSNLARVYMTQYLNTVMFRMHV